MGCHARQKTDMTYSLGRQPRSAAARIMVAEGASEGIFELDADAWLRGFTRGLLREKVSRSKMERNSLFNSHSFIHSFSQ